MAREYNVVDADGHVLEPLAICGIITWTLVSVTGRRD